MIIVKKKEETICLRTSTVIALYAYAGGGFAVKLRGRRPLIWLTEEVYNELLTADYDDDDSKQFIIVYSDNDAVLSAITTTDDDNNLRTTVSFNG